MALSHNHHSKWKWQHWRQLHSQTNSAHSAQRGTVTGILSGDERVEPPSKETFSSETRAEIHILQNVHSSRSTFTAKAPPCTILNLKNTKRSLHDATGFKYKTGREKYFVNKKVKMKTIQSNIFCCPNDHRQAARLSRRSHWPWQESDGTEPWCWWLHRASVAGEASAGFCVWSGGHTFHTEGRRGKKDIRAVFLTWPSLSFFSPSFLWHGFN